MGKQRKRYSRWFKAKVAMAALKREQALAELAARQGVHPTMISSWNKALMEGAPGVFEKGNKSLRQAETSVVDLCATWRWPRPTA